MTRSPLQNFLLLFLLAMFAGLFAASFLFWKDKFQWHEPPPQMQTTPFQTPPPPPEPSSPPPEEATEPITLMLVGDIMLNRGVEWQIKQNGGDWRWPFLNIADTLKQADLAFGNLESQISDKGANVGSIYSFRADPKAIEGLTHAGFDVFSVTNNHSFDYTAEALEDSISRLKAAGIATAPATKDVRGTKVGFLAYVGIGSPAWPHWVDLDSLDTVTKDVKTAKEDVDLLVVSLHAGTEYATEPNQLQRTFAKIAIEAGADVVVGHHPHVVQPLEQYQDGWIAYSIGNFVFDQSFSKQTMRGAILKVVVEDKKIKEVVLLPTQQNAEFQVELHPAGSTESM